MCACPHGGECDKQEHLLGQKTGRNGETVEEEKALVAGGGVENKYLRKLPLTPEHISIHG